MWEHKRQGKGEYMKKKGVLLLTAFLGIANVMTVHAANSVSPIKVYQEYENDKQYQQMVSEYGEQYGKEFIQEVAESEKTVRIRGGAGNDCYQFVKNIKQTKNYNCGSTTTLQTLYGLNSASAVNGSTDSAKIKTLDSEYNIDAQRSMYIYQVRDALNKYNKGNQKYVYATGKSMTISQFEDKVATSLTSCKPVVLHARTKYLSYYGGKASGHYLSLDCINRTSDTVRIVDCNNNSSYYGIHYVTLKEAYNSINAESGRYLIY